MIARDRAGMGKLGGWKAEHKMRWLDQRVDFAVELAVESVYVADGVEVVWANSIVVHHCVKLLAGNLRCWWFVAVFVSTAAEAADSLACPDY